MQDKAITEIGHWQLEKLDFDDPVDLYIENMFPEKDYQILLFVFEISDSNSDLVCTYKGIDIEKVKKGSENYRKYAYRKGTSGRAGDVTITTKISDTKKLENIRDLQFSKFDNRNVNEREREIFILIKKEYESHYTTIKSTVEDLLKEFPKEEKESLGISLVIEEHSNRLYLNDFHTVRQIINESYLNSKISQNNKTSKTNFKCCSISGQIEDEIYGFAAPFKYSSPDKPGFISGFFNKDKFWRNYPVSSKEALALEYGKKYIKRHLTGYFYGHEFLFVPHPIIRGNSKDLDMIVGLLKDAFTKEREIKISKEERSENEEYVQKIIAQQDNYFYLDMLFYSEDKKTEAISIEMMLEEILPSRFNKLFITVPDNINRKSLFKNAISVKQVKQDLKFSFRIISEFFGEKFLEIVQHIFLGTTVSKAFVYEKIISVIRKNYNESHAFNKRVEPAKWTILKAIMLINYLQKLEIIQYDKNYNYMDTTIIEKKTSRFNLEGFNQFVEENKNFLDSDIKVGIFAVGVLVRFLFDIQLANLNNTPFENKLRGYKLNPELMMQVYTEALDKIQKYQKNFYVYIDLREIINRYFVINQQDMNSLSNNELSFYFVAGLEMGRKFKNDKEDNNNELE